VLYTATAHKPKLAGISIANTGVQTWCCYYDEDGTPFTAQEFSPTAEWTSYSHSGKGAASTVVSKADTVCYSNAVRVLNRFVLHDYFLISHGVALLPHLSRIRSNPFTNNLTSNCLANPSASNCLTNQSDSNSLSNQSDSNGLANQSDSNGLANQSNSNDLANQSSNSIPCQGYDKCIY
jgi:hypothetical protein